MKTLPVWARRQAVLAFLAVVVLLALWLAPPAAAFDLFARHQVTAQFATADGKPLADAEVRVFAPGDAKTAVITGRTDKEGKFAFDADRDGFWSAEAHGAGEVARVSIRVNSETAEPTVSPFLVIGGLFVLLVIAVWYRVLRAKTRRPKA